MANAGHGIRIALALSLPLLLVLPTGWSLRAERAVLRETKAMLEADLTQLAPGTALGNEYNRLRALVLEKKVIAEVIDEGRMDPLAWLGALGTLPEGIVLTRAALSGATWEIEGIAGPALVNTLPAHFERAGLASEAGAFSDAAHPGGVFRLRGSLPADDEGGGGP